MTEVVCIGVAALDCIVRVTNLPGADERVPAHGAVLAGGGPAATAAVALRRLGIPAALCAVVGDDDAGRLITKGLAREGVDTALIDVRAGFQSPQSVAVIPDEPAGTRSLIAYRAPSAPPCSDALAMRCNAAAWVHVDQAGWAAVPWLRAHGVRTPISVDGGNPIPDLALKDVTLYIPSARELQRRTGAASLDAALERSLDEGAETVIATLGADGAAGMTAIDPAVRAAAGQIAPTNEQRWRLRVDAFEAPVLSTLGAGDVYHGALLAALVRGRSLVDALSFAAVAAALSCAGLDGRSAIPSWEEVMRHAEQVGVRTERVASASVVHA